MAVPAAAASVRLPSLTGLRSVAAFSVFLCHVVWSLSCELVFYLLFPLLLPLVRSIRPERLMVAAGVAAAASWAVPLLLLVLGGPLPLDGKLSEQQCSNACPPCTWRSLPPHCALVLHPADCRDSLPGWICDWRHTPYAWRTGGCCSLMP